DGALYIADFYNRIIGHYEVPLDHPGRDRERGRIWRVVYTGSEKTRPAEFTRTDWTSASDEELVEDLGHPNQWVRRTATNQLALRDPENVSPLIKTMLDGPDNTPLQKLHGLWALQRLGTLTHNRLKNFADDSDERVRVHVQRILAERSDWTDVERKIALVGLEDPVSIVRRNAAEALRRHPEPDQEFPLLDALKASDKKDIGLVHVLRMAARDQLNLPETWSLVLSSPHLHYYERTLGESIAIGSPTIQAAKFLMDYLQGKPFDQTTIQKLVAHVSRNGGEEEYHRLYDRVREFSGDNLDLQFELLKTVNEGVREKGVPLPEDFQQWAETLAGDCLASENEETLTRGLDLIQTLRLRKYAPDLEEMAKSSDSELKMRDQSLRALLEIDFAEYLPLAKNLLNDPDESLEARQVAAEAIGKYRKAPAIDALGETLQTSPWELTIPVAVQLASSGEGANRLIQEISQGRASSMLLGERKVAERLHNQRSLQIDEAVHRLTEGMPSLEEQVAQLIEDRKKLYHSGEPHPDLGVQVFEKNCAACHRIGELGQKIGPELDGIGNRGLDRILEDTLDPSRNVDQAYLASLIELDSGELLTGLKKGEEGELVLLADSQGEIIKISKDEIVDERTSKLSPMPSNVAADLGEDDFRNLMSFLLKQRVED
ncbi:MAG: c-type cytochrome, partial [Candidatus Omnitrophica bacterium]|nr:c-type cytochrome [Candidatus Omnitrophota bacterium]